MSDAFRQVRGHADIADFEKIRNLMESIDTGFIAWLGVEPRLERSGLGPELIRVTLQEMRARNIKTIWTSWELVDEELEGTDFQELIGVNSSIQEYVFACKGC